MATITLDLDTLVTSGIITREQQLAILSLDKQTNHGEGTSRFVQILATFGSIVTGLGVMLLIAANWDTISDMSKTILMIGSTAIAYALGYYFSYSNLHYTKTGQSLMLLGSLLYGASIMLLGQIYNLGGTFASALLVWALPVILLAYVTRFTTIFLLGITLIYSYIFAELVDSYAFSGFVIANIFISVGYLSLALLRYHRGDYQVFGKILSWTGGASILGGLFAYTFLDFWRYGGDSWYSTRPITAVMTLLFAIVGLGVIAIVVDTIAKKKLDKTSDIPLLLSLAPIGIIFFYTLSEALSNRGYSYTSGDDMTMLIPTIAMNIVYLSILTLMIYLGVRRDNRALVNIAMIYLALYLFGKYLAFAFDSKIDGAYIFIGGGIACIAMTVLIEKIRKRILLSMN